MTRRKFLQLGAVTAAGAAGSRGFGFAKHHSDDALLDDLSQRCFEYFRDAGDPETGICRDLIHGNPDDNARKDDESRGNTGVTGFALTSCCIGSKRKWIPRAQAKDLVRRALRTYTNGEVLCEHGWFYHFVDLHTGQRWKEVEMSTSDSIWLLARALTWQQYFHEDREIGDLATLLYSRYDFPWSQLPPLSTLTTAYTSPQSDKAMHTANWIHFAHQFLGTGPRSSMCSGAGVR
jgi:hypothetical protein